MILPFTAVVIVGSLFFGVIVDDEFYRTINTLLNLAAIALLSYKQGRDRREIEAPVKETAAVVRRSLGGRTAADPVPWDGVERRGCK